MSAPDASMPTPDRHTYTLLPRVAPNALVSFSWRAGFSSPLSTRSSRFWRTATTSVDMNTSRFHAPMLTRPSLWITNDAAPSRNGAMVWPFRYTPPRVAEILKPELNAAIRFGRSASGTCEPHGLGPPPGSCRPTTYTDLRSTVSSHIRPV